MSTCKPKTFTLTIYEGSNSNSEPVIVYDGVADDWLSYCTVHPRGFDQSYTLRLDGYWENVLTNQLTEYTETLIGYETIVKFGNTMQLKQPFTVHIVCSFE